MARVALVLAFDNENMEPQVLDDAVLLTPDNDHQLAEEIRDIMHGDNDGQEVVGMSRTLGTVTIEWQNGRGIQTVTTIIWHK